MRNNAFGFKSGPSLLSWAFPTWQDAEEDLKRFEAPGDEIVPVVIMSEDEAEAQTDRIAKLEQERSGLKQLVDDHLVDGNRKRLQIASLQGKIEDAEDKFAAAEAKYNKLLDKAGAYCGLRHSRGGADEAVIKAYLELRQFVIDQRAAFAQHEQPK